MANEIKVFTTSEDNVYCLIWNSAGQIWNVVDEAFETYNNSNFGSEEYIIECTLAGVGSRLYKTNFPTDIAAGTYIIESRTGAAPGSYDPADTRIGVSPITWNGDSEAENLLDVSTSWGSLLDMLEVITAALAGTTTVDTGANTVDFKDGLGNVILTITYGSTKGSRTDSVIS